MMPIAWHDSFDRHVAGTIPDGTYGWERWPGDLTPMPVVTEAEAVRGARAVDVRGDFGDPARMRRDVSVCGTGTWSLSVWTYLWVAPDGDGFGIFALGDNGWSLEDSTRLTFRPDGTAELTAPDGEVTTVDWTAETWTKLEAILDLDNGAAQVFWNDALVAEFPWTPGGIGVDVEGVTGGLSMDDFTLQRVIAAPCPADLNGDGVVDVIDMLALLGGWGPCGGCATDITGDGVVDVSDLLVVLGAWGAC